MGASNIISLFGGVALFLFGMSLMGDGLKKVAGNKMELVLYRLSSTSIKGILLGTAVTAVIQSSSATSVMVVGFVNSAIMTLSQAISVIMGSILGTSITGWVIALSELGTAESGIMSLLSTSTLTGLIAIVGIIIRMVSKKQSSKHLSNILLGFSVLMYGISSMGASVAPLKESESFVHLMTRFSNPVLGILVGILVTAVLQSASSAVGLLQTLSITGAIDFSIAFPILLGMNIGASVPVLLSSIGARTDARRSAFSYLLISTLGSLSVGALYYILRIFLPVPFEYSAVDSVRIALINTIFRFISVVLLFPLIGFMEKLLVRFIHATAEEEESAVMPLEERFLTNPAIALEHCREAVEAMANLTKANVLGAINLIFAYSDEGYSKVEIKENAVDRYEDKLGAYIVKLASHTLSEKQSSEASKYLRSIGDLERLSDHALNIAECAKEIHEKKIIFSEAGLRELRILIDAVKEVFETSLDSYFSNDIELAYHVEPLEELIDNICAISKRNHTDRLQKGVCTIENGFVYNDLLSNFERVSDHSSNIALAVIESFSDEDMYAHSYVDDLLKLHGHNFDTYYNEYAEKYRI